MAGILAPFLAPWRRRVAGPSAAGHDRAEAAPVKARDARRLARRLANALDRAMALGLWEQAERLARTAAPLAARSPRVTEPLARLRLAQGDVETALRLIDACTNPPSSLRMLRTVCLMLLGNRDEAVLELHRWSPKSSAPLDARLLLGLLERAHDPELAIRVLQRNLRHLQDTRSVQALLMLAVLRNRPEQADTWAGRLRSGGDADPDTTDVMLQSLGLPGLATATEPPVESVNALAMELIAFEPAIEPIVEAQALRPQPATVRLMRRAMEQALPDLTERAEALRALARLALADGDRPAALDFARRGLAENPMSAPLALLVESLSDPDPTPPVAAVGHEAPPNAAEQHLRRRAA